MYFRLAKPKISADDINSALELLKDPTDKVRELIKWAEEPQYRYWDTVRYKAQDLGIKPEAAWTVIDISRNISSNSQNTPIKTPKGETFTWNSLSKFDAFFHEVDMSLGGSVKIRGVDVDEKYRQDFIARGVMEEAIASSQLEGANTERKVAKRMLLEGRRPGTKSERMIVNNYKAMLLVEEEYKSSELTMDMLLRLHEVLTTDTLDNEDDCGRLRSGEDDEVYVIDGEGVIYHKGLEPSFVKNELKKLLKYANSSNEDSRYFTHPVVKAIVLHFWIGYLHPFADGNGRLARALFYWSLLKDGYWGFTYLPISRVIKGSHAQYGMAYVYTEQGGNDFTYFLDYNVRKIQLALRDFKNYAVRKTQEQVMLRQNLVKDHGLNDRQVRALQFLHANQGEFITTSSYEKINHISGPTAAKDVKQLVSLKFLERNRAGRRVRYYATDKIESLFKKK